MQVIFRLRLFHRKTFVVKYFTCFSVFGCTRKCGQRKTIFCSMETDKKIHYFTSNCFTPKFSVKHSHLRAFQSHSRASQSLISKLSLLSSLMLSLSFSVALSLLKSSLFSQALFLFCCSITRELRNQTLTLALSVVATALCPDNLLPLASSLALCRSDFLSPLSIDLSFSFQIYSSWAPLLS